MISFLSATATMTRSIKAQNKACKGAQHIVHDHDMLQDILNKFKK